MSISFIDAQYLVNNGPFWARNSIFLVGLIQCNKGPIRTESIFSRLKGNSIRNFWNFCLSGAHVIDAVPASTNGRISYSLGFSLWFHSALSSADTGNHRCNKMSFQLPSEVNSRPPELLFSAAKLGRGWTTFSSLKVTSARQRTSLSRPPLGENCNPVQYDQPTKVVATNVFNKMCARRVDKKVDDR